MKSENKLSYPLFSNLIISFLSLSFFLFNDSKQLVSVNLNNNNLKPIYEMESVENTENSVDTVITIAKKEVMSQNTYRDYYVKPSYNSVTGNNLANYARNYVGLPYVPAGSSLSTGTDCSGFTRLIYMEFGIQLGRTVNSQLYSGSYVSKEDLEPGDLVFYGHYQGYSSHVAIYLGDGLVIHESNPRDGVKISSVNIMVYQTARRLITANVVVDKKEIKEEPTKEESNINNELEEEINSDSNEKEELKEELKEETKNEEIENKQDQDNLIDATDELETTIDNNADINENEVLENKETETSKTDENLKVDSVEK